MPGARSAILVAAILPQVVTVVARPAPMVLAGMLQFSPVRQGILAFVPGRVTTAPAVLAASRP